MSDRMYQDRDSDGLSNRSLLVNASEDDITDIFEKEALIEYKSKVSFILAAETHLQNLNEQSSKLYSEGNPDNEEKIKILKAESSKTVDKIDSYDRQLRDLEATEPLSSVIDREREKALARIQEEGQKAVERARQKAAQEQEEFIKDYQEKRQKALIARQKLIEEKNTEQQRSKSRKHKDKLITIAVCVLIFLLLAGLALLIDYFIDNNQEGRPAAELSGEYEIGWDDGYNYGYAAALEWGIYNAADDLNEELKSEYGVYPSKAISILKDYLSGQSYQGLMFKPLLADCIAALEAYYNGMEEIALNAKENSDKFYK